MIAAFVLAVDIAALVVLAMLPTAGLRDRPGMLVVLIALTAVAGARPVRIPASKIEMTPTHPFIFVALAALGPMPAVLAGLAGVAGAAVGGGRRPAAIRAAFNLGAVALSSAAASGAFLALRGDAVGDLGALMLPLAAAAVAFFIANTGLVTAAIAIEKRQGYFMTWKNTFSWTPWSYVTGLTLAVAMLAVLDASIAWGFLLVILPCWMLVLFYRSHAAKHSLRETPST